MNEITEGALELVIAAVVVSMLVIALL